MKKVYIIHGWGGSPKGAWMPWLAEELHARGYEVYLPEMPDTEHPTIEVWVKALQEIIQQPNEETVLVGHSVGCQAILRYLERLPEGVVVKKCVFVAPWFMLKNLDSDDEWRIASTWLDTPINPEKVMAHCKDFRAIFSSNDPYVPSNNVKAFENKFATQTRVEQNMGHFDHEELPVVLEEIEQDTEQSLA